MPALITPIEDALIDRIKAALTRAGDAHPVVHVQAWPARAADYKMGHPVGATLVIYKGSTHNNGKAIAGQFVESEAEFEIAVTSRNLRDHKATNTADQTLGTGIYDLLHAVQTALMGWRMEQAAGAVRVVKDSFVGHAEGLWTYSVTVRLHLITVVNVPDVAGPYTSAGCDTAPPLATVTVQHPAAYFPEGSDTPYPDPFHP